MYDTGLNMLKPDVCYSFSWEEQAGIIHYQHILFESIVISIRRNLYHTTVGAGSVETETFDIG